MKKIILIVTVFLNMIYATNTTDNNSSKKTEIQKYVKFNFIHNNSAFGSGTNLNMVEMVCINGYVYINIYQERPVLSIDRGRQVSYPNYVTLASTTQSFIESKNGGSTPEKCKNIEAFTE